MHSGFSTINHGYREELMVEEMFDLYHLLNATPSLVIELIQKPELTNMGENRVYNYLNYLLSLIGNI